MARDALKVLIIEDDANIRELLRLYLEKDGYEVHESGDGLDGLNMFGAVNPSLVLLDIMLPRMDGWQICSAIRKQSDVPIIMLTAKGESFDKVYGLDAGADDYIVKPLDMKELMARVRAVLRRYQKSDDDKQLVFDKLLIDLTGYEIIVNGNKVETPPKELELLFFLASNPNRVFTRSQLLDEVWGFEYFGDTRTIDVHIKRLREKLEGVSEQWSVATVWGVGYKFELKES